MCAEHKALRAEALQYTLLDDHCHWPRAQEGPLPTTVMCRLCTLSGSSVSVSLCKVFPLHAVWLCSATSWQATQPSVAHHERDDGRETEPGLRTAG